jgi:Flp pilus assembly protein TadG
MASRMPKLTEILRILRRDESGGSLVETALTSVFLITMMLGSIELARVAYTAIEVANAAKAAVSYGAENIGTVTDTTGIQTVAADDAANLTSLTTTPVVSGICSDGTACTGAGNTCTNTDCSGVEIEHILTVTTSATYSPLIRVPGLPTSFTLHGKAVQKVLKN